MEIWHKYYCPLRPPDIGAVPPHPVRVEYVACEVDGRQCHGAVYYDRRLSAVEVEAYELLEEEKDMHIFLEHAKRLMVDAESSVVRNVVYFEDGRAYATNNTTLLWVDGIVTEKRVVDLETGKPVESKELDFRTAIPLVDPKSVFAILSQQEMSKINAFLFLMEDSFDGYEDVIALIWGDKCFSLEVRNTKIQAQYNVRNCICPKTAEKIWGTFSLKRFMKLMDYFIARSVPVKLYGPLTSGKKCSNLLVRGGNSGGVLAPMLNYTGVYDDLENNG